MSVSAWSAGDDAMRHGLYHRGWRQVEDSGLDGLFRERHQLAERRSHDRREAVEIERDAVAAGERVGDRAADLGQALLVDRPVDGQMRAFERGAGTHLKTCPERRERVHVRNNAGWPETLRVN